MDRTTAPDNSFKPTPRLNEALDLLGLSNLICSPLQPTSGTDVVPTSNSFRNEFLIRRSRLRGTSLGRKDLDGNSLAG